MEGRDIKRDGMGNVLLSTLTSLLITVRLARRGARSGDFLVSMTAEAGRVGDFLSSLAGETNRVGDFISRALGISTTRLGDLASADALTQAQPDRFIAGMAFESICSDALRGPLA